MSAVGATETPSNHVIETTSDNINLLAYDVIWNKYCRNYLFSSYREEYAHKFLQQILNESVTDVMGKLCDPENHPLVQPRARRGPRAGSGPRPHFVRPARCS